MEPGFNVPRINPEQTPSLPPVSPELLPPDIRHEVESPGLEREASLQPQQAAVPISDVALPAVPQPVTAAAGQDDASLLTSVPDVAADDDLIEKEWVDKAKRIIAETADDPYRREQAVGQLQREYLRKRYGKEIGVSE